MFNTCDLKYLDDPKLTYGEPEEIHTFNWTSDDMGEVMIDIQNGMEPEAAAAKWVDEHDAKVQEWIDGLEPVDGDPFTLSYVAWDSELVSTNVVRYVLDKKLGYAAKLYRLRSDRCGSALPTVTWMLL
ncbi:hypothetical protein HMSSN036_28110 [Paenibacillus macerans]|nr:hypothetical protein HMSSN036_28110 [Paenibacillus macerans]